MARLTLTYSDLYKKVSEFLGLGSSPTGTNLTKVKDIVARGYRQFLYPIDIRTDELHEWSFLKQFHTITTKNGQWKYALPKNFSDFIDVPHFDDEKSYKELTQLAPEQILEQRSATVSEGFPIYFALAPYTYDNSVGTFYEFWIDPVPDAAYVLKFFYRIDPLKPENDSDFLIGGIRATEAILESCLKVAEQQEDDKIDVHTQIADKLIQDLIKADIQNESDVLGNLSNPRPNLFRWYFTVNPDIVYESEGGLS